MPEVDLIQYLAAGGDVGIFALIYIMWRFDRRLLKLELIMLNFMKISPDDIENAAKSL